MPRIWKIRFALLAIALLILAVAAGATIAQSQRDDEGREVRRIERKVDAMETQQNTLRVELENRLTKLESQMAATAERVGELKQLIWGAIGAVALQLLETLGGMLWARKQAQRVKEQT